MKREKGIIKLLSKAVAMLTIVCIALSMMPIQASATVDEDESGAGNFRYMAVGSDGYIESTAVVVVISGKGACAYTFANDKLKDEKEGSLINALSDDIFDMTGQETINAGDKTLCSWQVERLTSNSPGVLSVGPPTAKRDYIAYYMCYENDKLFYAYDLIEGLELAKDFGDGTAILRLGSSLSEIDSFMAGMLLNEEAECIGILMGNDRAYCDWFDANAFEDDQVTSYSSGSNVTYKTVNNLKRITYYDDNGMVTTVREYDYNVYGDQTGYSEYDGAGKLTLRRENTLNEAGKAESWKEYDSNGDVTKTAVQQFTDFGKVMQIEEYDPAGTRLSGTAYQYDEEERQTIQLLYNGDMTVKQYTMYYYDSDGNNDKDELYFGDGSLGSWYEYFYDENGNKTKSNWYVVQNSQTARLTSQTEYTYNSQGDLLTMVMTYDGGTGYSSTTRWKYENEYNSDGKRTRIKNYKNGIISSDWVYEVTDVIAQ